MALECLDWSVLAQFTHMNAHVCAAGGKRVVALPVHIQSWSCRCQTQTIIFKSFYCNKLEYTLNMLIESSISSMNCG